MFEIVRAFNALRLELNRFGYVQLSPRWKNEDSYVLCSRIFFVESGQGYLKLDDKTMILEPGYMYLIPARTHVAYGCTQLKKIWFQFNLFSGNQRVDLLSYLNDIYVLPYEQEDFDTLLRCMDTAELYALLQVRQVLLHNVCRFAHQFQFPPVPLKETSAQLQAAISYIQANAAASMTAKQVSQKLFMSESALRHLFKTEMNTTVGKYIDLCTMNRAKALLVNPDTTIGQVSQELGFCDQFYFSRRFKQRYHMTPREFRAKQRK